MGLDAANLRTMVKELSFLDDRYLQAMIAAAVELDRLEVIVEQLQGGTWDERKD